jgi:nucleotidyltransferase substrate binding protein (TIGR01987 family)
MALDLSSLKKAISSLESAVRVTSSRETMAALGEEGRQVLRAGVIQNFELSFELYWKFIQRWIRLNKTPADAEPFTRKDLFRMAVRYGLVEDPLRWFEYSDARNLTSHAYDEDKARQVFETAVRFLDDARNLLNRLEKSND